MKKRPNVKLRKRAEIELKESEAKYRQLFQNSPDPIIVHLDNKVLFSNQAAADFLGFSTSAEIHGKCLNGFIHREYLYVTNYRIKSVQEERKTTPAMHIKMIRIDGKERDVEVFSLPFDYNGKTAVKSIMRDITVQKKFESELRASEERFRSAFDNSAIAKAITELDGKYIQVNEAFCKFTGYSGGELLGLTMSHITYPEDIPENVNGLRCLIAGVANSFRMEQRYIHKSGSILWGSLNLSLVRGTNGEPRYLIGEIQDITHRKLTQEALDRETNINNALTRFSEKLLYTNNIEEISLLALKDISMFTQSEFGFAGYIDPGKDCLICTTITGELGKCGLQDKCKIFKHSKGLYRWPLKSGESILSNNRLTELESEGVPEGHVSIKRFISVPASISGKVVGQIALANSERLYTKGDIQLTERYARLYAMAIQRYFAEQELRDINSKLKSANRELEKISQYKTEFFATMSHELKTPLAVVLAIANELLAKEAGPLNRKQIRYIKSICESGQQLLTLINNILDLSKIDSGKMVLNLTELRIGTIARSVVRKLTPLAKSKGIRVKASISDSYRVVANAEKVRQVISNLLDNAIKFSSEGQLELTVLNSGDDGVLVEVSDSGPGISPEEHARIFDAFYQVNRGLNKEFRGTGLGLALVKKIIDLHTGSISIESTPGIGTVFRVLWPRYPKLSSDLE